MRIGIRHYVNLLDLKDLTIEHYITLQYMPFCLLSMITSPLH